MPAEGRRHCLRRHDSVAASRRGRWRRWHGDTRRLRLLPERKARCLIPPRGPGTHQSGERVWVNLSAIGLRFDDTCECGAAAGGSLGLGEVPGARRGAAGPAWPFVASKGQKELDTPSFPSGHGPEGSLAGTFSHCQGHWKSPVSWTCPDGHWRREFNSTVVETF